MATKSSKSLCTSATAIMDSRGSGGAFAGPGHAVTADKMSRRKNIQARGTEIQTGRRNTSLPLKAESQKFSENIRVAGCPYWAHLRLPTLHKSTARKIWIPK